MKKQELRKKYKELRSKLSSSEIESRSKSIANIYIEQLLKDDTKNIHCFLPMPGQAEVDTWLIINKLWENKRGVITSSSDFKTLEMKNFILEPDVKIEISEYGIPEPVGALTSYDIPDHIIVPLLTFDKKGNRVGYGKGFYDRFLSNFPGAIKIGVSLFDEIEEIDDVNEFDVPLDHCITSNSIINF